MLYLSIVVDHVHPLMATIYPSSNGYFPLDTAPYHKTKVSSNWFCEHVKESSVLQWSFSVIVSESNRTPLVLHESAPEIHRGLWHLYSCVVVFFVHIWHSLVSLMFTHSGSLQLFYNIVVLCRLEHGRKRWDGAGMTGGYKGVLNLHSHACWWCFVRIIA